MPLTPAHCRRRRSDDDVDGRCLDALAEHRALALLLLCTSREALSAATGWGGPSAASREALLARVQAELAPGAALLGHVLPRLLDGAGMCETLGCGAGRASLLRCAAVQTCRWPRVRAVCGCVCVYCVCFCAFVLVCVCMCVCVFVCVACSLLRTLVFLVWL